MVQNPFDDCRVLDAGDDLDGAAALLAGFDVDLEYPFKTLRPGHGGAALGGSFSFVGRAFAAPGGRHLRTVFAVGGKHAVEASEVYPRFGHQGGQAGDEVQRVVINTTAVVLSYVSSQCAVMLSQWVSVLI